MGFSSEATSARTSRPIAEARCSQGSDFDPLLHRSVDVLGDVRVGVDPGCSTDAVVGKIAEAQRERVTRAQLLAGGVSPEAVKRRLRNGSLIRVHQGIYALPHTGDIPLAEEAAALLACGEGAALSHHSAVTLWGLRPGDARPIHVTIPAFRGFPAPTGARLHRSRILLPADIRIFDGLPITAPARTLLDVAAGLPDRDLERLLYEAIFVRRLVTTAQIAALLSRAGRHPGRARLIRVSNTEPTGTDSPPAEALLRLIRAAGLPEPQTEVPALEYRLDFFWPELNLAVEVDAYGTHGSPARFEDDRRRDARLLTELGIVVIRITRATIEQRTHEALTVIARAIGQREAAIRSLRSRSR